MFVFILNSMSKFILRFLLIINVGVGCMAWGKVYHYKAYARCPKCGEVVEVIRSKGYYSYISYSISWSLRTGSQWIDQLKTKNVDTGWVGKCPKCGTVFETTNVWDIKLVKEEEINVK